MRTAIGAAAANIAKPANLRAPMIDTFLDNIPTAPSSASVPDCPPFRRPDIPKMPYDQFQTDMSPAGYWLHTSVALATTPLLLKKIFM